MALKQMIDINVEKKREVAQIKGITVRCVNNALSYSTNSDLSRFIRAWCLENGGVLMQEVPRKAAKIL